MRCVAVFVFLLLSWADAQFGNKQDHHGNELDENIDEHEESDSEYPSLTSIPQTSFSCAGREPGYYADFETNCQVFRVCTQGSRFGYQSFICPKGTLFNQNVFVCDWWTNVKCDKTKEVFTQDRFGHLKLGPQLMNDVNKMLTHTFSNQHNEVQNDITSQDFRISSEQTFSNGNNNGYNQVTNNGNVLPQQQQYNHNDDIAFSASTASPQYTNTNINSIQSTQNENLNSNHRTGRYETKSFESGRNSQNTQNNRNRANAQVDNNRRGRLNNHNTNNHNLKFSDDVTGEIGEKAKENLVSSSISPTIVRKTLTFNKIVNDPLTNVPKSRIVFKTWILKSSKSGSLTSEATLYPKTLMQKNSLALSYIPVVQNPLINNKFVSKPDSNSYYFNQPTIATKQTTPNDPPISYLPPALVTSTLANQLPFTPPTQSAPPKPSKYYLAATTFKPNARLYLPPPNELSRLYLPSHLTSNAKLIAAPSSVSPFSLKYNYLKTFQSQTHTPQNNLIFSEVVPKDKSDYKLNDIVQDTNKVKVSASQSQLDYKKKDVNYYIPPKFNQEFGSKINFKNVNKSLPMKIIKKEKYIVPPSSDLQPPLESSYTINVSNPLSLLPYYIKPTTIERTISLRITIPENIANYLFKHQNESSFNKLEISNTGSSNYIALVNDNDKFFTDSNTNTMPIGKLVLDNKQNDLLNSQGLVFSYLSNTVNEAKEQNSVQQNNVKQSNVQQNNVQKSNAQQNQRTKTVQRHRQRNFNNRGSQRKSKQISQLTSSQFSGSNNNGYNYNSPTQTTTSNSQNGGSASYSKTESSSQGTSGTGQSGNSVNNIDDRNAKITQQSNTNSDVTVQFVPSVSYEIADEKEQENIFNIFKIDTTDNSTKETTKFEGYSRQTPDSSEKTSNVDTSSEQTSTPNLTKEEQSDKPNALYAGPSSYSAPQSSIGNLETKESEEQNKSTETKSEQPSSGYAKRSLIHLYAF